MLLIQLLMISLLALPFTDTSDPIRDLMETDYEEHFISSGDNFPQISLEEYQRHKFLVGLHMGLSVNKLAKALEWDKALLQEQISTLKDNGYLKQLNGNFYPSINIITQKEGKRIFLHLEPVARELSGAIKNMEACLRGMYNKTSLKDQLTFEEMSFFLYSNVLLDNWQINAVEKRFLKKDRPLRHGNRYYIQYAEKDPEYAREVFGIYGNQYLCQNGSCFITYGNNRTNNYLPFRELEQLKIPVASKKDQQVFDEMASVFLPELIKILESQKEYFHQFYESNVYKNETSFEEFFIWYYHFLYTRTTDILEEQGHITIPRNGIFRIKLE